jgi:hypothetical protein
MAMNTKQTRFLMENFKKFLKEEENNQSLMPIAQRVYNQAMAAAKASAQKVGDQAQDEFVHIWTSSEWPEGTESLKAQGGTDAKEFNALLSQGVCIYVQVEETGGFVVFPGNVIFRVTGTEDIEAFKIHSSSELQKDINDIFSYYEPEQ